MNIVRFINEKGNEALGVWEDGGVYDISAMRAGRRTDLLTLHAEAKLEGRPLSDYIAEMPYKEDADKYKFGSVTLLPPVDAPEVWASGVTYEKSRSARNTEIQDKKAAELTVYDKVYDAVRPEIFFKSTSARTASPDSPVCIRSDSNWQIPEPEVALVLSSNGEIIGFTAGNDMSSRDIEGENPLYLPQAKVWRNSCSFGPSIKLAETINNPYDLEVICSIYRNGDRVFQGTANVSQLKRTYDELIEHLLRDNVVFDGTVLFTGTCIVPPDDFTLQEDDRIDIEVSHVGVLTNTVSLTSNYVRNESV